MNEKIKFIPISEDDLVYRSSNFTGKMKTEKPYQLGKKANLRLLRKLILDDLNKKNNGHIKPSFVKFIKKANYNQLVKLVKTIK